MEAFVTQSEAMTASENVRDALRQVGRLTAMQAIEVVVEEGKIVLKGVLPSYYLMQLAHAACLKVVPPLFLRSELTVAT